LATSGDLRRTAFRRAGRANFIFLPVFRRPAAFDLGRFAEVRAAGRFVRAFVVLPLRFGWRFAIGASFRYLDSFPISVVRSDAYRNSDYAL
jgi:hypothetical protein